MPAPASMRQTAQLGVETTYGVPVAVTKRFTSFGLGKERNMGVASSTPRGQTAATQGWVSSEDSAYSIEDGVLSFDEVVWLLNSAINKVAPTTPPGGTVLSKQRLYRIDQFAADTFASYTIEQGDVARNRGGKAAGGTVQEWGFSVSSTDDSVGMTGNLVGWKLTDGAMTNLGQGAATDFQVVIPNHFKLYYGTTWAALTGTPVEVTNAFTAEFGIGDRRNLVRYLGKADGSPSDVVETVPSLTFDLTRADEAAPVDTFLSRARAGQKIFFRLQAKHPTAIEATVFPEFTLDLCTVLRDGPSDDDEDGVQVVNFPLQPAYDPVSNEIFNIKVINNAATPA